MKKRGTYYTVWRVDRIFGGLSVRRIVWDLVQNGWGCPIRSCETAEHGIVVVVKCNMVMTRPSWIVSSVVSRTVVRLS